MNPAKAAELMNAIWVGDFWGPRNVVLDGPVSPQRKGHFWRSCLGITLVDIFITLMQPLAVRPVVSCFVSVVEW